MTNLKDELAWRRTLSGLLDKPQPAARRVRPGKGPDAPIETCPFCQRTDIRTETMSTIGGPDGDLKIGFFTCRSCSQTWSEPIR